MIPIADESPKGYVPFVNYTIIVLNIALYFFWQQTDEAFFRSYGLIPYNILHNPLNVHNYTTVFTSMFMHGGLLHLFGNMLYLWIFGDNIEYTVGHGRYVLFYLIVGLAAALFQTIANPMSQVPMVGASGAISGVLGAYLIKYPRNRISILFFFIIFFKVIRIPAAVVLSLWFLVQLYNGYFNFNPQSAEGVAWFAHIGGFAAGLILIKFFEKHPRHESSKNIFFL